MIAPRRSTPNSTPRQRPPLFAGRIDSSPEAADRLGCRSTASTGASGRRLGHSAPISPREAGARLNQRAALKYLRRYIDEANPSPADVAQVAALLAERVDDARAVGNVLAAPPVRDGVARGDKRSHGSSPLAPVPGLTRRPAHTHKRALARSVAAYRAGRRRRERVPTVLALLGSKIIISRFSCQEGAQPARRSGGDDERAADRRAETRGRKVRR
jgi:hypothetical protein